MTGWLIFGGAWLAVSTVAGLIVGGVIRYGTISEREATGE